MIYTRRTKIEAEIVRGNAKEKTRKVTTSANLTKREFRIDIKSVPVALKKSDSCVMKLYNFLSTKAIILVFVLMDIKVFYHTFSISKKFAVS